MRNDRRNLLRRNVASPLNLTLRSQSDDDIENMIPDDDCDPDAFHIDGSWNENHLRKIINVMDVFKISYEAYHELRMTSNSLLPPLSVLKKARTTMSHVIQILHHRTVKSKFI